MSRDIQPHQRHRTATNAGVIGLAAEIRASATPQLLEQEALLASLPEIPGVFGMIAAGRLELVREELARRHGGRVAA